LLQARHHLSFNSQKEHSYKLARTGLEPATSGLWAKLGCRKSGGFLVPWAEGSSKILFPYRKIDWYGNHWNCYALLYTL